MRDIGQLSISKGVIFLIFIFSITVFWIHKPWKNNLIVADVVSYYGYLPAIIIHNDATLKFTEKDKDFFFGKYWPEPAPNGGRVIKTTMGLAFLYAPFFLLGHFLAPLVDQPQDGFSPIYQITLLFSCVCYLILGFYFLRKLLLTFFSETVTALTMFSVYFGTNLLWYTTLSGLMSHGYLFSLLVVFIYLTVKWHERTSLKWSILVGLVGGLITIIRPTMIIFILVFALYNTYNSITLKEKISFFKKEIPSLLIICACFIIPLVPQLIYWKYVTGDWLFFSYVGERFYFNNPHLLDGLFGFRKGWFIYTPIMTFAVIGLFFLKKRAKVFLYSVSVPFLLSIFILLSWWAWWYGGSFGQRAFIDFYGLLAVPIASFYSVLISHKKKIVKVISLILIFSLIYLNLFQTKQYHYGSIHYDSMTRDSYLTGFFNLHQPAEWWHTLEEPNYERAKMGLPETYSSEELNQIKLSDKISLKGYNLRFVSSELDKNAELTCNRSEPNAWETFSFIYKENGLVIKASNGKYVSSDLSVSGKLIANRDVTGTWEKFKLIRMDDGKIALRASNNKYVSVRSEFPNLLYAEDEDITKAGAFRIYIEVAE